jgi:hypothetical protein
MRPIRGGSIAKLSFAIGALVTGAACVDLFHTTDFPTLCDVDASACAPEAPDADVGDARPDAALPIDLCAGSSSDARTTAERACGYLGACFRSSEDGAFGACMLRALAAYDCTFNPGLRPRGAHAELWDCLSKAGSCKDTELCVFGTVAPKCKGGGGGTTVCNSDPGSVVIECGASTVPVSMTPCALRGRSCTTVDPSKSICAGKLGAKCSTVTRRCDGTFAIQCVSAGGVDADEGFDCANYGDGRCATDAEGVGCVPVSTAESCTGSTKVVCNGSVIESCVGGKRVKVDCTALDQTCTTVDIDDGNDGVVLTDPIAACKPANDAGACSFGPDTCSGDTLRSCERGVLYEMKCSSVGLGPCAGTVCTAP